MALSPIKLEILEALLIHSKPAKAAEIAKEIGKDSKVVQMHLIGLTRTKDATTPEKGSYLITEKGKLTIGIPNVTKTQALTILAPTPREKAFHFYTEIGKPLNLYAHDLLEFCEKITEVNQNSVEFHMYRGDFEAWFRSLGDIELAKKTAILKERKVNAEELRIKLHEMAETRCMELSKMAGQSTPPT